MDRLTIEEITTCSKKARHAIFSKANTTLLSQRQHVSLKDPGVRGKSWVIRVAFRAPPPEQNDARQLLINAIEKLGHRCEEYTLPLIQDVNAQWTGFRPEAALDEVEPSIPEQEKYEHLMKDVRSGLTIFYIQGGAFVFVFAPYFLTLSTTNFATITRLNSPARFRTTTTKLAELIGGRCISVSYRLPPQNPFPAALLDIIITYLSLIYPPVGSYHSPVAASSIVLTGDSSGGNLALALIRFILTAHQDQAGDVPTVRFHNQTVPLPMPCGVALQSPVLDLTNTLPSWYSNGKFDLVQETSPVK